MEKHYLGYPDSVYERDYNVLYIDVNPSTKAGLGKGKTTVQEHLVCNLAIYDIGANQLSHFFELGKDRRIISYLYEKAYQEEKKCMIFNRSNPHIFNNDQIEMREKADKLFILAERTDTKERELWVSNRLGQNQQLIKAFDAQTDWRLDVFNQKILFIFRLENAIEVEAVEW